MFQYSFETSQPLTAEQLAYINRVMSNISLPTKDPELLLDIPEWTTDVVGPVQREESVAATLAGEIRKQGVSVYPGDGSNKEFRAAVWRTFDEKCAKNQLTEGKIKRGRAALAVQLTYAFNLVRGYSAGGKNINKITGRVIN